MQAQITAVNKIKQHEFVDEQIISRLSSPQQIALDKSIPDLQKTVGTT